MKDMELEKLAASLKISGQYRITQKYLRPEYYHIDDHCQKFTGVFLDLETTGLDHANDKIIELGMVRFEYSQDGRIFRILDDYNQYSDPGIPIPPFITQLTGISDEMLKGQHFNLLDIENYLKNVNLIISHNAQFDRGFFEIAFPSILQKPWACSMKDIDWKSEGFESCKLEYIAYKYEFFYEGHRAIIDCLAGIHILSKLLPKSQKLVFSEVLDNCRKVIFKLWATGAPYAHKDLLKKRGYKWDKPNFAKTQAWSIELRKNEVKDELSFLREEIYGDNVDLPIDIIDAYTRFSNLAIVSEPEKYKNELEWIKLL